jgi:hypothetical protein
MYKVTNCGGQLEQTVTAYVFEDERQRKVKSGEAIMATLAGRDSQEYYCRTFGALSSMTKDQRLQCFPFVTGLVLAGPSVLGAPPPPCTAPAAAGRGAGVGPSGREEREIFFMVLALNGTFFFATLIVTLVLDRSDNYELLD